MKKYLVVLLCIVMALSAIGCSGEEKSMNSTQETTNEVVTVRDGHNLDRNVIGKQFITCI